VRALSARSARLGRSVGVRIRKATTAQGMGESGLSKLIELHAFNAGGDAAMAIGLAGTLFFQVPSGEARGKVALYLLLTMAPFVLIAPLLGPMLDRLRRGRRWAIGTTMAGRAFFCWVLAGAITTDSTWLYPVAFLCLVASKTYGLTRAAGVPRLLPPDVRLVTANSRISLAGVAGAALSGAVAGVLSAVAGPQWSLRWAFVVFVIGTVLAIRLPARVDSPEGETRARWWPFGDKRHRLPTHVVTGLQVNTALRAYSGFLLTFMAFMLRERPFDNVPHWLMFTLVGGAAGAGSVLGTGLGSVLRARPPIVVLRSVLGLAAGAALAAALFFNPVLAIVAALAAGLCQQLGKLSLDALIQAEVPDDMRTSVFARSETLLQSGWVLGGVLGIILPLWPWLGFGLAAAWLAGTGVFLLYRYRQQVAGTRGVVSAFPR
jgi:MFS family permease